VLSVAGYVASASLLEAWLPLEWQSLAFYWLPGAIFGALVAGPYVAGMRWPLIRVLALCAVSPVIYRAAVDYATDGSPFGQLQDQPFATAGGMAAFLVFIAIVALAPARFHWRAVLLVPAAGVLGGLAFVWLGDGDLQVAGHLAWQLAVCLALHFGLRKAA
jgi:hypothetical protein